MPMYRQPGCTTDERPGRKIALLSGLSIDVLGIVDEQRPYWCFFAAKNTAIGTLWTLLYKLILENMLRMNCNISQYFCVSHNQRYV